MPSLLATAVMLRAPMMSSKGHRMNVGYDGPIIDVHTHLMLDPQMQMVGEPHPPDRYIEAVDGLDVRHAGALAIAPPGDLDRCRTQNDRILELSNVTAMFYAVASVHPHDGEAALMSPTLRCGRSLLARRIMD